MTSEWTMFHGDAAHSGVITGAQINATNAKNLKRVNTLEVGGAILSVPAVTSQYVYVGTANGTTASETVDKGSDQKTEQVKLANGGSFHKIALASGEIEQSYYWQTDRSEGDTHGFTGMGCTPAVVGGFVFFVAFDGCIRCLNADTLAEVWCTDLRKADSGHNQPVTNTFGTPNAEGWSSPVVANGKVYTALGEGENPDLYSFVYCMDAGTGDVEWIFCLNKFSDSEDNPPNLLPSAVVSGTPPSPFTTTDATPLSMGNSVWSAIAYDADLNRLYMTTGNPQPDNGIMYAKPYSYGILSLDADTGAVAGFYMAPVESNYRVSDIDTDFGGSPLITTLNGQKVVVAICKNGGFFVLDAESLQPVMDFRQVLPFYTDGGQIPGVDPHGNDSFEGSKEIPTNEVSNQTAAENLYGSYSTPVYDQTTNTFFVGLGGNNYHFVAPGIDYETTPFMRALSGTDLSDAWNTRVDSVAGGQVERYDLATTAYPTMPFYQTAGESGLSSPFVLNDVVVMTTSKIALYVFDAATGEMLFEDQFGAQTQGFSGGYGYCLGAAGASDGTTDYIVAGGLVLGRDGGVLCIYTLDS